jgi:hypothetical protein
MTVHWRSDFRRCKGSRWLWRLQKIKGIHVSKGAWYTIIDGYLMRLVLTKNVQNQNEPDLGENHLSQERDDYSEEVPLRFRWERYISHG